MTTLSRSNFSIISIRWFFILRLMPVISLSHLLYNPSNSGLEIYHGSVER
ncbi:hypothetical protein Bandiella_00835 [Candidatus Bandiella woodruffii]|uniref:Uncharacterized protein n=1 Tax=Candidatus Bandiella euplotis TaxID=1664265 RepID=A0ABZ0UKP6_9RICK|nr:hypothetical protein Bandiella_00835 [Candidatus Bandiella woodruffii]